MRQEPATRRRLHSAATGRRSHGVASQLVKTRDDYAAQRSLATRNESEAQPQLNVALPVC